MWGKNARAIFLNQASRRTVLTHSEHPLLNFIVKLDKLRPYSTKIQKNTRESSFTSLSRHQHFPLCHALGWSFLNQLENIYFFYFLSDQHKFYFHVTMKNEFQSHSQSTLQEILYPTNIINNNIIRKKKKKLRNVQIGNS